MTSSANLKLLNQPSPHHIAVEMSYYNRKYLIGHASASRKAQEEADLYFVEVQRRKDQYQAGSGQPYEPPTEVGTKEKNSLVRMFKQLNGWNWNWNFGWVGLPKTSARAQVKVFEVESSLFEGINVGKAPGQASHRTSSTQYHVTAINMTNNNCEGDFPNFIHDFRLLHTLKLNWNLLSDSLPRNLSQLTCLSTLNLANNCLEGKLSREVFASFERLQELDLSFNCLHGPLPDVFDHYSLLTQLDLSGNEFTGHLPSSLSTLKKLTALRLYQNRLSGDIGQHTIFGACLPSLVHVDISDNKLTGTLDTLMNCTKLRRLIAHHNQLRGEIPASVSQLQDLEVLYLHNNRLTGPVPAQLCLLTTHLRLVNLSNNLLCGVIPHDIGNLIRLDVLCLHGNDILGPIPLSLSQLTNLRDFSCFANCPSEGFQLPRAFSRRTFERLYVVAPKMKVDTVYWDPDRLYEGTPPEAPETVKFAPAAAPKSPTPVQGAPGLTMSRRRPPPVIAEPQEQPEKPYDPTYRVKSISAARAIKYRLDDV